MQNEYLERKNKVNINNLKMVKLKSNFREKFR
jgi:hypothetical protein